jgi:hypothetical protein
MYKTTSELQELQKLYNNGKLKPTKKEKLTVNPKLAYEVTSEDVRNSIPFDELRDVENIYGKLSRFSLYSPVDNLLWDYFHFVNPDYFRPAGVAFQNSVRSTKGTKVKPTYTKHIKGTKAYNDFWEEEFVRITKGYEPIIDGQPCGIRIPGEFYFYLNYGWIKKIELDEDGNVIRDESDLPDFLAMDYYYFKEVEARENPKIYDLPRDFKQSMAVVKSRRKGFSYKAGSGAVWITAFKNKAKVLIASITGSDAVLCFEKAMDIVDHVSKYTPFGRTDPGLPANNGGWKHETMSMTRDYGEFTFGIFNTKTGEREGRQSIIQTTSLYNKPDAASGEGLSRLYFEEAGKIDNLSDAWTFAKESMRVGSVYRGGIAILFGTGGDMVGDNGRKGSSRDLSNIYNSPETNGIAAYENIYDYKPSDKKCGYFVSDMWFNPGSEVTINGTKYIGLDRQGNAFFWVAELHLNKERIQKRPPNGPKKDYDKFLTQRCKTPSEAFLITTGSRFQTEDLIERQNVIMQSRTGFTGLRMPGELVEREGIIEFIPKPNDLYPVVTTAFNEEEKEGCLVRYEAPMKIRGVIPEDAYLISVDPIGMNTESGKSMTAIVVFKTSKYAEQIGNEKIVATYYGRKKINPQGYVHQLLVKLSKYYNAKITFENDRDGGILSFFLRRGELDRLLTPPVLTMEKHLPGTKTNLRQFGHSMATPRHKQIGEDLLYEWLDKRGINKIYYDTESGEKVKIEGIRNVDCLEDQLMIEQLINYDRNGNYDLVMALMGIMVQLKEWYDDENEDLIADDDISDELGKWYKHRYKQY